jgi:hypothetical protein
VSSRIVLATNKEGGSVSVNSITTFFKEWKPLQIERKLFHLKTELDLFEIQMLISKCSCYELEYLNRFYFQKIDLEKQLPEFENRETLMSTLLLPIIENPIQFNIETKHLFWRLAFCAKCRNPFAKYLLSRATTRHQQIWKINDKH